jgi:hypothetical protein
VVRARVVAMSIAVVGVDVGKVRHVVRLVARLWFRFDERIRVGGSNERIRGRRGGGGGTRIREAGRHVTLRRACEMTARLSSDAMRAAGLVVALVLLQLLLASSGGADARSKVKANRGDAVVAGRRGPDRDDGWDRDDVRDRSFVVPIRTLCRRGHRGGGVRIHERALRGRSAVARRGRSPTRVAPLRAVEARLSAVLLRLLLWRKCRGVDGGARIRMRRHRGSSAVARPRRFRLPTRVASVRAAKGGLSVVLMLLVLVLVLLLLVVLVVVRRVVEQALLMLEELI